MSKKYSKNNKNNLQNLSNISNISNYFSKTLTVFGLFSLTFNGILLTTLAQNTTTPNQQSSAQGGLGVMPTNIDPKNSQTKNWFLEQTEPGSTLNRNVKILNFYKDSKEIEIRAKDSIQTRDGGWDFRDNSSKDEFLGSWIKLEKDKVNIEGGKSDEVKFDINVPKDTKSGEYGAVISAQLPPVANNEGVAIENRIGSRIYLTVPGDLKMAVKMDKFEFLSPKSQNYKQSGSDKVAMQISFENMGNIFTKSFGKVQITAPDGQINQVVDKDVAPRQNPFLFNFTTDKKWQPGKYKAKIEINNRPIINNKGEIADSSPAKTLETEFDMTQDIINTITKDRQNPVEVVNQVAKTNTPSTFQLGGNDEKIADKGEKLDKFDDRNDRNDKSGKLKIEEKDSMMPIIIGGGVLGLIIIALLVFLLAKKGKKEEENASKTNSTRVSNSQNVANSKIDEKEKEIKLETVENNKKS